MPTPCLRHGPKSHALLPELAVEAGMYIQHAGNISDKPDFFDSVISLLLLLYCIICKTASRQFLNECQRWLEITPRSSLQCLGWRHVLV
jgi:hypothetical protein